MYRLKIDIKPSDKSFSAFARSVIYPSEMFYLFKTYLSGKTLNYQCGYCNLWVSDSRLNVIGTDTVTNILAKAKDIYKKLGLTLPEVQTMDAFNEYPNGAFDSIISEVRLDNNESIHGYISKIEYLLEKASYHLLKNKSRLIIICHDPVIKGQEYPVLPYIMPMARMRGYNLLKHYVFPNKMCKDTMANAFVFELTAEDLTYWNNIYLRDQLYGTMLWAHALDKNNGLEEITLLFNKTNTTKGVYMFRLSGLNMTPKVRKVCRYIVKNRIDPKTIKVKLIHKPFVGNTPHEYDAFAVKVMVQLEKKWFQLGWIPKMKARVDIDEKTVFIAPNTIVAKMIDHDEVTEYPIIDKITLTEIDEFKSDDGMKYFGKIKLNVDITNMRRH